MREALRDGAARTAERREGGWQVRTYLRLMRGRFGRMVELRICAGDAPEEKRLIIEPSSTSSIRVSEIGTPSVLKIGTPRGEKLESFSMLVDSVLFDARLSFAARCVYGALAKCARPPKSPSVGIRRLAAMLGAALSTVRVALDDLAASGHIVVKQNGANSRRTYELTSNRFRARPRKSIFAEAGGEVIEYYNSEGVDHKRQVVSRPRSSKTA
jgi:hypothetical protein